MSQPPFTLVKERLGDLPAAIPLRTSEPTDVPELDDGRGPDYLDRFITQVTVATLTPYLPAAAAATGAAVLICPGGGYHGVAIDKEGHDIARWLNHFGVAGFVLKYRSPNPAAGPRCQPYGPLRDAQRALRLIRSRASEWRLDEGRVGILGFSAGGHLAASASTLFTDSAEAEPALAGIACRPDFTVLIYPVVSFTAAGVLHAGSRHNLLGAQPPAELSRHFSCELQVTKETPPAFLVHTGDDGLPVANSLLYYQALQQAGVRAELHLFPEGGHGYGMRPAARGIDSWPERCREWLLRLGKA
jgi:acetyl esterase/lipase